MSNNGTMEPEWNIDRNKWPAHDTEMEQHVGSVNNGDSEDKVDNVDNVETCGNCEVC